MLKNLYIIVCFFLLSCQQNIVADKHDASTPIENDHTSELLVFQDHVNVNSNSYSIKVSLNPKYLNEINGQWYTVKAIVSDDAVIPLSKDTCQLKKGFNDNSCSISLKVLSSASDLKVSFSVKAADALKAVDQKKSITIDTDVITLSFDNNNHTVYTPGNTYNTVLRISQHLSTKQSVEIYGYGITNLNKKVCEFDQDQQECTITFDIMKESDEGFPDDPTKAQIVAIDSGGYISQLNLPICGSKSYLTILPKTLVFDQIDARINMKAYYCNSGNSVALNKDFFIDKYNDGDHYDSRGVCYDSKGKPMQQSDTRYCRYSISPDSDAFNFGISFPEHNKEEYKLDYGINDLSFDSLTVKALAAPYMIYRDATGHLIYDVDITAGKSIKLNWFQRLMYINIVGQDDIAAKVMIKVKGAQPEWQEAQPPFSNIIVSKYYDFALTSDFIIDTKKIEKITQTVELKIVFSYRKNIHTEIYNNELLVFLVPNT